MSIVDGKKTKTCDSSCSGYATLFSLQNQVRSLYQITDPLSREAELFGVAISFVYLGNLTFRLSHNFLFAFLSPRQRVLLAIGSMALSMSILCSLFLFYGVLGYSDARPSLVWPFIAYGLGGVAIGTFESNLLSCITPLGKETKNYAIIGMPLGIVAVTVGVFTVQAIVEAQSSSAMLPPDVLRQSRIVTASAYGAVCVLLVGAIVAFRMRVFELAALGSRTT